MVAEPLCIPTSGAQGFQFLHILVSPFYFLFIIVHSHPGGCAGVSHCGFDLHSLMSSDVQLLGCLNVSFGELSIQALCLFFFFF